MRKGFTLAELLIVISIIIILLAFVLINVRGQIVRATDAKRKSDLYTLKNVIEEYNNDHASFPPTDVVATCGGNLSPYITQIPCDPQTRNPYGYFLSESTGGYRICAILADTSDPAISAMNCGGPSGCGLGGGYNYCLAQGVTPSAVGTADETSGGGSVGITPTPTGTSPTLNPSYKFVCTINGQCNSSGDPAAHGCPVSWEKECPPLACDDSANRCTN